MVSLLFSLPEVLFLSSLVVLLAEFMRNILLIDARGAPH